MDEANVNTSLMICFLKLKSLSEKLVVPVKMFLCDKGACAEHISRVLSLDLALELPGG